MSWASVSGLHPSGKADLRRCVQLSRSWSGWASTCHRISGRKPASSPMS